MQIVKTPRASAADEGWEVRRDGELMATTATEYLADVVMTVLLNGAGTYPREFIAGQAYFVPGESNDEEEMYCQNCEHRDSIDGFCPSDGNPAPLVCPVCGLTDVFTANEE